MDDRRELRREHDQKIDALCDKTSKILCILNGNGKIGLVSKVELMWKGGLFIAATVVGILVKIFF